MKKNISRRVMSAVLGAALLVSSGVPVYASGTGNSDVTLQVETGEEPSIVSVNVPTEIPLKMDKEGVVTVPQDLKITNLSDSTDVELTGLSVTGKDSWVVKDYSEDLSSKSEGTKELSMSFRGDGTTSTGDVSLTKDSWVVNRSSELLLNVSAKLPKQGSEYKEKGSIAQVNYTFAVKDESTDPNENAIRNDWSKDKVIKDSVTPVTFDVYSTSPDTHIVSVESSNAAVTIEKAPEPYSAEKIGSEVWNVKANNWGISTVTATLNTGETTTFTVNVYELNIPDGGDSGIEIELPDKKPGDNLETGDITIDIPIKNPDGSDGTITVTPEIPDGTPPLVEGENNINIDINIDINISINIDITINVSGGQQPSEQFTVTYITDGNGSVSEDSRKFNSGSNLTFPTATPNEGYVFDKWVDTTTDTEVTGNTLVNSNMEVKAVFVEEPEEVVLESIEVTKQPDKVEYVAGENFDPTGMEITAHYSDGSADVVDGWTVLDGDNLTIGKNTVTVQYIEDGITKECTVNITVNEAEKEIIEIELTTENKSLLGIDGTETELDFSQPIEGTDGKLYQVVAIGDRVFNGNQTLQVVNLTGVKRIGDAAFYGCSSMYNIVFDPKLESVGAGAFNGGVAFPDYKILYIPEATQYIGNTAFGFITHIYYSGSLIDNWGDNRFGASVNLANCSKTTDGIYYNDLGSTVEFMFDEKLEKNPESYNLNKKIDGKPISKIGRDAFEGCSNLISVTVPTSLKELGVGVFSSCISLDTNSVDNIMKTVSVVGNGAFYKCENVKNLTIYDNIKYIDAGAFDRMVNVSYLKIEDILNTDMVKQGIMEGLGTAAPSLTIDGGFNESMANGIEVNSLILRNVTEIPYRALENNTTLKTIVLPDTLRKIQGRAFENCTGLTSVTIPNSVSYIGGGAFLNVPHIYYNGSASGAPWGALAIN